MFTTVELYRALTGKGFFEVSNKSHTKLVLFINGAAQPIWTVVSHSRYDVGSNLQSIIARELRMPNSAYLRRFVECSVSAEEYTAMLRDKGVVD